MDKKWDECNKKRYEKKKREDFELIVLVGFGVLGTYVGVAQGTVGIMD